MGGGFRWNKGKKEMTSYIIISKTEKRPKEKSESLR